jgi:hypothetical protein
MFKQFPYTVHGNLILMIKQYQGHSYYQYYHCFVPSIPSPILKHFKLKLTLSVGDGMMTEACLPSSKRT